MLSRLVLGKLARFTACKCTAQCPQLNPAIPQTLKHTDILTDRHIGPNNQEAAEMLKVCGVSSLDQLIQQTIPKNILIPTQDALKNSEFAMTQTGLPEHKLLEMLKSIASKNQSFVSLIGCGYHPTIMPNVILRNVLENPAWYTSYTPYQAEISQGRLESLLHYQTMINDMTKMDVSNASLLDESTAAAESMNSAFTSYNGKKKDFFVSKFAFPQNISLIETRAESLGVKVVVDDPETYNFEKNKNLCGVFLQTPDNLGRVKDFSSLVERIHKCDSKVIISSDLLSLTLCKPAGEMGADIAIGSNQRFGLPMGFGGPHAGYMSVKKELMRKMPGRIIGISIDNEGRSALRMALGTREQHIKREKATSNICTAQALLANLSAFYAMYHGPAGLNQIATRINSFAQYSSKKLREYGYNVLSKESEIFDTVCIQNVESDKIIAELAKKRINIRKIDEQTVCFSTNEATSVGDIDQLLSVLASFKGKEHTLKEFEQSAKYFEPISPAISRKSKYLTQDAFNKIHSEHQMLRFLYKLQLKDISLANSMIPLGSCTMKLNPTSCMIPITWPEFGNIHPFAPQDQCEGYKIMIDDLCEHLKVVTGFDAVSLQPNSGAQGELTGLLVIRKYVGANRNIVLIPHSAHGTNPASTAMAGLNVVEVKCDKAGNVDVADLKAKADKYKDKLACLMITYPSTHGVFESSIREMIDYVHKCGGQVYMDGANMNAQCGFTSPGFIGADVCHLNLHKTFAIPHGGGGPGVGPIAVKKHLAPLLPTHPIINMGGSNSIGTVSAAPYGSASILPISWVYLRGLGKEGVIKATATAILNANYLMSRLKEHYKILFTGENGRCAHEFLIDLREFKKSGITESDVAKRLMDFGIHSPTMSFPVAGTLMTEPTESEDKGELDRFCDAMIEIRKEIQDVIDGKSDVHNNPLVNAPHCLDHVTSTEWKHPYSREKAAYPLPWVKLRGKFWPTVGRIDNVYGDKNLKLVHPDKYEQL